MVLLYNFGIHCFFLLMQIAALFNPKAKKWIAGRKIPIASFSLPKDKQVVWFHCASLGEFDQGLPVMNAYKNKFPDRFLVVSFFSPSGMEFYNKRDHQVDLAVYLPLDTPRKAGEFVAHFNPKEVFFVKYEFWYNHLKAAKNAGAKIYGVSSLFRPTHRFFSWYGGFFRKALHLFDQFFTQDERSKNLLNSIGIHHVQVTGDTRYDRMIAVLERHEHNVIIEQFKGEEELILLGSSWPIDEEILLPALLELQKDYKIVIAPHDISSQHISAISALFGSKTTTYSSFQISENRILILDTIGQLSQAYRYADMAYIGGGFTGKLHNILEPGAFGIPIFFGPKFERFPEAQLFIDRQVAFSVSSSKEWIVAVQKAKKRQTEIHFNLTQLFNENAGAAARVLNAIQA